VDVDLFDQGTLAMTRPAWQVIEAARRRYLTGLLVLDTTPVTNVYLRDGQVYFADRSTDGGLGVRLLVEGVITREQMHRATLMVGGVEHLGRMFDRDSTIDRDAVELCVELMTDDVLTGVADAPVTGYKLHLYKRHPSGVDRWLPTRVEVVTHLVSDPSLLEDGADVAPGEGPRSRPHLVPPPATGEVKIPTAAHAPSYAAVVHEPPSAITPTTADDDLVAPSADIHEAAAFVVATDVVDSESVAADVVAAEPPQVEATHAGEPDRFTAIRLMSLAEAVTDVIPVVPATDTSTDTSDTNTDQASGDSSETPTSVPTFASVPPAAFTTLQIPALPANSTNGTNGTNGTYPTHGTNDTTPATTDAGSAERVVVEVLPGSIADEVAEAVRRALAAIDMP
jgi:hypothetical protein